MAKTPLLLSTPALKRLPKVPSCSLETAYQIALRQYSSPQAVVRESTPVPAVKRSGGSGAQDNELHSYYSTGRRRAHSRDFNVPLVPRGFGVVDAVEVGGVIIKAQRKIVRCTKRSDSRSPVRPTVDRPPNMCQPVPGSLSTSSSRFEISSADPSMRNASPAAYTEVRPVASKALCFTDTYSVDDGWGVIVCVMKNWVTIRGSSLEDTKTVTGRESPVNTGDMRHPPHGVGDFVRVRGRLFVKPIDSSAGPELPKDFSKAYLRATAIYGARDARDEAKWFAEVYSELESVAPANEVLGTWHRATTWARRGASGLTKIPARLSV